MIKQQRQLVTVIAPVSDSGVLTNNQVGTPISDSGVLMYKEMSATPPLCIPDAVAKRSFNSLQHGRFPTISSPYVPQAWAKTSLFLFIESRSC